MNNKEILKKGLKGIYKGTNKLSELYWDDLLDHTLEWFKEYQGNENPQKMLRLYEKLMDEERKEILNAWYDKNIEEVLDGIVDYMWVTLGYLYFGNQDKDNMLGVMKGILGMTMIPEDMLRLAYLEIAYSNWTKSKEKRDDNDPEGKSGKIIKGKDFVKPNIKKVFNYFKKLKNG